MHKAYRLHIFLYNYFTASYYYMGEILMQEKLSANKNNSKRAHRAGLTIAILYACACLLSFALFFIGYR